MTDCIPRIALELQSGRSIDVDFDAPEISSNGGLTLIRQVDDSIGLTSRIGALLPDKRDERRVLHPRLEQLRQRIYQIVAGYEDANDASALRHDRVLMTVCDVDPAADVGLSSQPTLSRFENSVTMRDIRALQEMLEDEYVAQLPDDCEFVLLDVDGMEDVVHGGQQLSFFNGYYDAYMYFPMLVFDHRGELVTTVLRPGNLHDSRGVKYLLERVIRKIKARFPSCHVLVRGDAAFGVPRMMRHLEKLDGELGGVDFIFGLVKNKALNRLGSAAMATAQLRFEAHGTTAVTFDTFEYAARSWEHPRYVVTRALYSERGGDPRYVVTSLSGFDGRLLYRHYSGRGVAENHIKEFKNALVGDRLSCTTFVANFFRLLLHAVAYRLMRALRTCLERHAPQLAHHQFDTIRLKLLKVAAIVRSSVRRVHIRLSRAFPLARTFRALSAALAAAPG